MCVTLGNGGPNDETKRVRFDTSDRMILPPLFSELEEITMPFTLEACANDSGDNASCKDFCSPSNSFLQKDCSGHHVWINPPFKWKVAKAFLEHYLKCKDQAPTTTSACVMLPEYALSNMKSLLKDFRIIRRYPKRKPTVNVPDGKGGRTILQPGLHFDLVVLYDPPKTIEQEETPRPLVERLLFQLPCSIAHGSSGYANKVKSNTGFDSMASRNFISSKILQKLGTKPKTRPRWDKKCVVTLGDNSEVDTLGIAKVQISMQGFNTDVWCEVLSELPQGFDLILGQAFLHKHKAALSYEDLTVNVKHATKTYTLVCGMPHSDDLPPPPPCQTAVPIISALQVKRLLKKHHALDHDRTYLVFVKPKDKVEITELTDPEVESILQERTKLFSEIPKDILTMVMRM